jgi:hypothetical protein
LLARIISCAKEDIPLFSSSANVNWNIAGCNRASAFHRKSSTFRVAFYSSLLRLRSYPTALKLLKEINDSSHTLQTAFGYILSKTRPRLGVATHFPVDPNLITPALHDIRCFYKGPVAIAKDLLLINISKSEIRQRMAAVPGYPWYAARRLTGALAVPKYPSPTYQLNDTLLAHVIPENLYNTCNGENG